jgi:hypothetical protein
MYGHPALVRQWARSMRPSAPARLVEQARLMREAKAKKAAFLEKQHPLFTDDKSGVRVPSPYNNKGTRNTLLQPTVSKGDFSR